MSAAQPTPAVAMYKVLRELGSRSLPSYAALREPRELLVVTRFVCGAREGGRDGVVPITGDVFTVLNEAADCLARNWHPNIARVRHVDVGTSELTIASELVDGATLEDLLRLASVAVDAHAALPLPVLLRILLDVLAGLHALHALRGPSGERLGLIHGELGPANVVVGRDGVARLINVLRPQPPRTTIRSEAMGYAAPELVDGDATDPRADVYAVGVILWEALRARRLFDVATLEDLRTRQREGEIDVAGGLPDGALYLAAIAMRALAFEPALRFRTAAEMASEIRKPKDAPIASGSVVASWVASLDGERIRGRRAALDPSASGTRPRASEEEINTRLGGSPSRSGDTLVPSSSKMGDEPPTSPNGPSLATLAARVAGAHAAPPPVPRTSSSKLAARPALPSGAAPKGNAAKIGPTKPLANAPVSSSKLVAAKLAASAPKVVVAKPAPPIPSVEAAPVEAAAVLAPPTPPLAIEPVSADDAGWDLPPADLVQEIAPAAQRPDEDREESFTESARETTSAFVITEPTIPAPESVSGMFAATLVTPTADHRPYGLGEDVPEPSPATSPSRRRHRAVVIGLLALVSAAVALFLFVDRGTRTPKEPARVAVSDVTPRAEATVITRAPESTTKVSGASVDAPAPSLGEVPAPAPARPVVKPRKKTYEPLGI